MYKNKKNKKVKNRRKEKYETYRKGKTERINGFLKKDKKKENNAPSYDQVEKDQRRIDNFFKN